MRSLDPRLLAALAAVAAGACGDDAAEPGPDARPFVRPEPVLVPIAPAGPDQLVSAAPGPAGSFYAAGFAANTVGGTPFVTVVRLLADGSLDRTFGGGDGIATTTLEFAGVNAEVNVGVQPGGQVVVSATVPNVADPADQDVAVLRLDVTGALDRTFGDAGVRRLDLTTAANVNGIRSGFDASRGLAVDPASGALYVAAVSRNPGMFAGEPRTDTDLTVVKLGVDGAVDQAFGGGDGRYTLDLQMVNEAVRGIAFQPDGTVLISGYANTPALGSAQPLLVSLSASGVPVPGFADGGIFHQPVLAMQAEVYTLGRQADGHAVSCGYGRQSGSDNDWLSLRFDLTTGTHDATWGGAAQGGVLIDPTGAMVADNCRNAIALPGDRTLLVGSAGVPIDPGCAAGFAVLDATGHLDAAFGGAPQLYQLGQDGVDQFWGGAVSGEHAIVVGFQGGGPEAAQTAELNDDAYAVVLDLP